MNRLIAPALALALACAGAPDARAQEEPEPTPDYSALAVRYQQLTLHQGFGLATLGAMATTAGLGLAYANGGSQGLFGTHAALAGLTTGLYLTTATMALTAPAPAIVRPEAGWDSVTIHRNLAWLHAAGLASTVGLGLMTVYTPLNTGGYHDIAAFTTLGLMAVSAGVIAFGQ